MKIQTKEIKDRDSTEKLNEDKQLISLQDSRVCHFSYPDLSNRRHFDILKNQMGIKLKILSEKISVALSALDLYSEKPDVLIKKLITTEVNNHLESLTKFERNLSLCLLERFETLRIFECPSELKEIQKELEWLESNFEQYLQIIRETSGSNPVPVIFEDQVLEPDLNMYFNREFQFCTNEKSEEESKTEQEYPKSLIEKSSAFFRDIYPADDKFVESLVGFFFVDFYNKEQPFVDSKMGKIVQTLCCSATFEAKVIDFCITLLYSPTHVDLLAGILNASLYSSNISNPAKMYETTACNVLNFLAKQLDVSPYLRSQPRAYFERCGLQSLREFKQKTEFMKRTSCLISLYDLLIGLFAIEQIKSSNVISSRMLYFELNKPEKHTNLLILSVQEGEELKEVIDVITTKACKQLLQKFPLESTINESSMIVLGHIEPLISLIHDKVASLSEMVDKTNSVLKEKIAYNECDIGYSDIESLLTLQDSLDSFANGLTLSNLILTKWLREKHKIIKKGQEMVYKKAFQEINTHISQESKCKLFIINLFELADYLASPAFNNTEAKNSLIMSVVKALLSFCSLHYIGAAVRKSGTLENQSETEGYDLPSLSNLTSSTSVDEITPTPELSHTFSALKQLQQYDFDQLLINMCKKHQQSVLSTITQKEPKGLGFDGVYVLCKKIPWILDFNTKKEHLV